MEHILGCISLKTTLEECICENWDDYAHYIEEEIYNKVRDLDEKLTYNSKIFNELKIEYYFDSLDKNGLANIYIRIEPTNDNFTEDDFYDKFETDKDLLEFMEETLTKYVKELNNAINTILIPVKDSVWFNKYTNSIYIEISPNQKYISDDLFKSFKIDADISIDKIIDGLL